MTRYHKKFTFRVEIDGLNVAHFKKAGPLQASIGVIEENEGGALAPTKEYGKVKYDNITLAKGVTDDKSLWDWIRLGLEGKDEEAERDLSIVQTNRAGREIKRWNVYNALPIRHLSGDWDSEAEEAVIEEVELAIESYELAS